MSFVFLINGLSIFIAISVFLELFLLSKIDLEEQEGFKMKLIVICSSLAVLIATVGRAVWGESLIYEAMVSISTGGILAIWFIIFLCVYNYLIEETKWRKSIKQDKKDYFVK